MVSSSVDDKASSAENINNHEPITSSERMDAEQQTNKKMTIILMRWLQPVNKFAKMQWECLPEALLKVIAFVEMRKLEIATSPSAERTCTSGLESGGNYEGIA